MNAKIEIDPYILDTLMRDLVGHDRRPSAYLVYLALVADAVNGRTMLSHAELAERTGLSKRAVQDALRHLGGRDLVTITRARRTEAAVVEPRFPWRGRRGAAN
ncbi:helix-turn-helix domain-containing protein [Nitrospirillum sp. BR 11163]|uniref:helix-turn-helix domain-containing protein n=1 Tax=Nitrospirillum sp. BR 11163 TaxID=3104323 RepID=UPI002AFE04EA|nr:helix-turn-helix domain-containing protein [Nitrospirillum sp. BR 11163]MEA1673265.1 helix-turn-helix domain-containing protein [Nitrospirillum sp. BR 11163]